MHRIPREQCPIEADYAGQRRTRLVVGLSDRQEGMTGIDCFVANPHALTDDLVMHLKERVTGCTICEKGINCPLGELILKAQLTAE